jgi:basic amino acid/polyamine antiporter, APA family
MSTEPAPSRIEARLSTFDTAMVVFSLVVGIGIFRTPAIVARAAGSTQLFFTAWLAGGLVSLIGAFVFAEIGSRYPRAGGYYRVVADCYHPTLAFILNWSQTISQGASSAGVAFIGAEYLMPVLLPERYRTAHASLAVASATMLVLLTFNYRGIRPGARTQNLLSMLKIAMIAGLALSALWLYGRLPVHAQVPVAAGSWVPRFTAAIVPSLFAYGGYQMTMNLGADLRNAPRRFPVAIGAGMLTVVTLYLLLNIAYYRVLGINGIASSKLVAAALSGTLFGAPGEVVFSLAVFLSAAGYVNATILQMPRSLYAMAQDGVLPRAFLRVNPTTQAQEIALLFFGAAMLLPALVLGTFEKLLNYVIFNDTLTMAVAASTLFILRRRTVAQPVFSLAGSPFLTAFYIACLLAVSFRAFSLDPLVALTGVIILLTGWPLFLLGRRVFGHARQSVEPEGRVVRESERKEKQQR